MLFRLLGFRGEIGRFRLTRQFPLLPIQHGYEFCAMLEHITRAGVISGHERCDLFEDFADKDGIFCIIHDSLLLVGVEMTADYECYFFLHKNASPFFSTRQSGHPVIQGVRELIEFHSIYKIAGTASSGQSAGR